MSARARSRRPRVAYIAFYFPPTRASGVYRSRATANHLAAAGWDVTVLTPQREFFTRYIRSYDGTLEATVRGDVRVDRVRFPARPWETDVHRFSRFRGTFPQLSQQVHKWAETRFFPEHYSPWIPRVVRRVAQLHRVSPFDVVLATGNPFSSFAAAWALGRLLRVPYVVDYRDSWTLDLFKDAPAYPADHPAWSWERRILRSAARSVFVNEPLRDWHAERYPQAADRMRVVENGWEPDLLGDVPPPQPALGRPLRYGYLGTVTPNVPVAEFLQGWGRARASAQLQDATATFYGHLGFFPASVAQLRDRLRDDPDLGVSYAGPVGKAEVTRVYEDLDVLLLVLAGGRYVTSGKVYEYMATGRPIVSVHDGASAAKGPLQGYPLWFPAKDLSPDAVADALLRAGRAARELTAGEVEDARRYAADFTRDARLAPFEQELRGLVRA